MTATKKKRTATAVQCLEKEDVCRKVASYFDSDDLLSVSLINKMWSSIANKQFSILKSYPLYSNLTFRSSSTYITDKRACSHISNLRKNNDGRMVLMGGAFESPNTDTCILEDNATQIKGRAVTNWETRNDVGAFAATYDLAGNVMLIGGWDDAEQEVLDTVYLYDFKKSREKWTASSVLPKARCFGAAERTIQGDVLHFGGGDSPYRGAGCFAEVFIRKVNEENWQESVVPSMQFTRCGHSVVTLFSDSIVALGGYSGGTSYLASVEMLAPSLDQWVALPSMRSPRSGMAAVIGPCGAIYVAGGSPDGLAGSKTLERFDPREGVWTTLADMHKPRGYTTGCLSLHRGFYVASGVDDVTFHDNIEHYDFRTDTWTLLQDPAPPAANEQPMLIDEVQQMWDQINNLTGPIAAPDNATNDEEDENEEEDQGSLQFEEFSVKSTPSQSDDGSEGEEGGEGEGEGEHHHNHYITVRKGFLERSCHAFMRIL